MVAVGEGVGRDEGDVVVLEVALEVAQRLAAAPAAVGDQTLSGPPPTQGGRTPGPRTYRRSARARSTGFLASLLTGAKNQRSVPGRIL